MNRNSKRVLAVMAIVAIAAFGTITPSQADDREQLPEGQAKTMINITGMTCGACCTKVEAAVAELKGVVDVKADYEKGTATVTYIADQVDVKKIVATINEKTSFKAEMLAKKKKVA